MLAQHKIHEKSRLRRGCIFGAVWGGLGVLNGRVWEPKPSKYHQNGSQNRSQIDRKSRLRRGCVFGALRGGPWAPKGMPHIQFAGPFWEPFSTKNRKNGIQKSIQKSMPKKYRKMMQKGSKMIRKYAKIFDFSCFFEKGENARNYLFYNIKRGSGHLEMHQKSIQNRCKIDARKRHAKSMENDAKMLPKWKPKSI